MEHYRILNKKYHNESIALERLVINKYDLSFHCCKNIYKESQMKPITKQIWVPETNEELRHLVNNTTEILEHKKTTISSAQSDQSLHKVAKN